jgi:hypothetical protein
LKREKANEIECAGDVVVLRGADDIEWLRGNAAKNRGDQQQHGIAAGGEQTLRFFGTILCECSGL